jgi:hypothetical protein
MKHLRKFNEGLERDEEEYERNPSIYLAKSWAIHYLANVSGRVEEKVDLLHKMKIQAINSNLPELIDICKDINNEYSRIKRKYTLSRDSEERLDICENLLKLGDELVEKLRNIK